MIDYSEDYYAPVRQRAEANKEMRFVLLALGLFWMGIAFLIVALRGA